MDSWLERRLDRSRAITKAACNVDTGLTAPLNLAHRPSYTPVAHVVVAIQRHGYHTPQITTPKVAGIWAQHQSTTALPSITAGA